MHHLKKYRNTCWYLISFARQLVCITFIVFPLLSCRAAESRPRTITVLGDSLTAGYGLENEQAFPAQLQVALRDGGWPVTINNAGVSGDTTAGGLARLDWVLQDEPEVLIIQLGANDALRGLPPATTRQHLEEMITRAKSRGIRVILAGMQAPLNLGQDYRQEFNAIYPNLAKKHDIPLYPFFLAGVVGRPNLNLDDRIHPNAEGVQLIVMQFAPFLLRHIK